MYEFILLIKVQTLRMKLNHFQDLSFTHSSTREQHPAECKRHQSPEHKALVVDRQARSFRDCWWDRRASWQFPLKFTDSVSQQNHYLRFNLKNTRRGMHTEKHCSVCGSYSKQLLYNFKRWHKLMAFARYKPYCYWSLFPKPFLDHYSFHQNHPYSRMRQMH